MSDTWTSDEIAGDPPAATGNANVHVEVSMHRKRLMMSVDSFAHLLTRAGKLANFFELVQSNGFNSSSMVGINSVTVG
jgi:hypothetical protein